MEENFDLVARTRANYYTPGSPVQFVCVELLKGEQSGDHAVCLTFKNISRVNLTALEIHFKCKGVDGVILCEDAFEYRDMDVKPGESFGMDDAVFVTRKAITSVDVQLKNVYSGKRVVHLDAIKRSRLPAPRRLSPELQKALEDRMNRTGLKFMPQVFENGWYCSCGAFHPKEEDTVYCSECGSDRILLQNALNNLLQPAKTENEPAGEESSPTHQTDEELTRVHAAGAPVEEATRVRASVAVEEPTRACIAESQLEKAPSFQPELEESEHTRVIEKAPVLPVGGQKLDEDGVRAATALKPVVQPLAEPEEDDEEEDGRDRVAEALIRWVPPITAVVCAGIALWGFVYYQFVL